MLKRLRERLRVPISIDTRKAAVARVALDEGAAIVNDVSALVADPAMAPLAAARKCAVVLMHMRGGAADHMKFARYRDVVSEVEAASGVACPRRNPRRRGALADHSRSGPGVRQAAAP